ncbi:MAG: hypothetical protein ABFR36_10495 [Acidobacteriota bacterium]
MRLNKIILSVFIILFVLSGPALDAVQNRGVGFKSMSFGVGLFSLDGNLSFHKGNNVVTFKLAALNGSMEGWEINLAGVMYEYPLVWNPDCYASVGGGIAYNWGVFESDGKRKEKIGFPLEAKFVIKIIKYFGIGLYLIYNFVPNESGPYWTIGATLYFGK